MKTQAQLHFPWPVWPTGNACAFAMPMTEGQVAVTVPLLLSCHSELPKPTSLLSILPVQALIYVFNKYYAASIFAKNYLLVPVSTMPIHTPNSRSCLSSSCECQELSHPALPAAWILCSCSSTSLQSGRRWHCFPAMLGVPLTCLLKNFKAISPCFGASTS